MLAEKEVCLGKKEDFLFISWDQFVKYYTTVN